jgi:hypothetical protein
LERAILRLGPRLDRSVSEGLIGIGNHEIEIEVDGVAKAPPAPDK